MDNLNLLDKKENESTEQYNERVSKMYYANGYYIEEIANKLNIDMAEVYNYVTKGRRKITTEAEREAMIDLYNKGCSYSEIGLLFNKSRQCVRERIKRPCKTTCKVSKNLTDEQLSKMLSMDNNGENLDTIANELGIKVGSLRNRLKHCGKAKTVTYTTKKEINKFIRLYKNGESIKNIAIMCNRHRDTVAKYIHAAGL